VLAVAILAAIVAGWWLVRGQPHRLTPIAAGASMTAGAAASPGAQPLTAGGSLASPVRPSGAVTSGAPIVVDVVGRVARPGVYRLPSGSRVDDAVRAAGGAVAGQDLSSINLARKLIDGEQVAVGVAGAVAGGGAAASGAGGTGASGSSGPIDLNSATAAQLDSLPGVGPVLAQRIVDWRTQHGRFDSVDQLQSVTGVGASKFADLRPLVAVS
jgi:competence protein ComEA